MSRTAAALASAMILAWSALPRAQEPASAASLDRMRAVLTHKPLKIDVPDAEPTFKIEIKAIHPMHEIFEKPPWQLPPVVWRIPAMGPSTPFGSMPLLSVDVLAVAGAARHAYDERRARQEVQRAIAGYCAAQPNAQTIQICSTSLAIR
jgi:hypothetical protein